MIVSYNDIVAYNDIIPFLPYVQINSCSTYLYILESAKKATPTVLTFDENVGCGMEQ